MPPCSLTCCQTFGHLSNVRKLLQCIKCLSLFHGGCIKCLDLPILLDDQFYIFICKKCNKNSECLGRWELDWVEVTHLLLHNLTVLFEREYFHLDDIIVPFLQVNWDRFHIFGPVSSEKDDIRAKILEVLCSNPLRFKSAKEPNECQIHWALQIKLPPEPPQIVSDDVQVKEDGSLEIQGKDKRYHLISIKKPIKKKESKGKQRAETAKSTKTFKNGDISKYQGSAPSQKNGILKTKTKNQHTVSTVSSFNEESARCGLLDSVIPVNIDIHPFGVSPNSPLRSNMTHYFKDLRRGRKNRWYGHSLLNINVTNGQSFQSSSETVEYTTELRAEAARQDPFKMYLLCRCNLCKETSKSD